MSVELVSVTDSAEETMAYISRVSSPHQENPEYAGLLNYCIKHQHWSVFEHAFMTLEISTSRMISQQIVRHRSFTFSEFSQRYSEPTDCVIYGARRQADKNRQSSVDDCDEDTKKKWEAMQDYNWRNAQATYDFAIKLGIAKECARAVLPLSTATRLYMTGSVRSWIHYITLRCQPDTQLEHREIAEECRDIFVDEFPTVATALGWSYE